MSHGPSRRLVIEVDPKLKNELHAALASDGTTLKEWFISYASSYLINRLQPTFPYLSKESDSGAMLVAEVPLTDSKRSVPLKTDPVVYATIRKD